MPKGAVPPTWYPVWRCATSGAQGATDLRPAWRARFLVETLRSPCIRTMSGFFASSSITSVLTIWCSGTFSASAGTSVPPWSTY
jgi:hypothetical protein